MKDLDFIDRKEKFRVGDANKRSILEIIKKDCQFFVDNGIIDYSLLVGVNQKNDLLSGRETPELGKADCSPPL